MTSIIIKKIDKSYEDSYAIETLLYYIYRYENNYTHLPTRCYGIDAKNVNYIIDRFYDNPEYGYDSDLSHNVIHIVVSFPRKRLITRDRYLVDNIAQIFGHHYYTAYSFHEDSHYAHAHIVVSTRNKNTPLTSKVYQHLYKEILNLINSPIYNNYYRIMRKEDYYV